VCILAHPTEYLWRVQFLVTRMRCWMHPLWVQSRTTVVETLLTKMPASAVKDQVRVTMTCGNLLSVHTTYPL
jgi:hypothetical protein